MAIPTRRPRRKAATTARPMAMRTGADGPMELGGGGTGGARRVDQLIVKLLLTEKGLPPNAGTCTPLKRCATHAPVGVPSKGGPEMVADWAPPLGAKTTTMRPVPVTSPFLHPWAACAAVASLDLASPMLNSAAWVPAGAAAGAAVCAGAAGAAGWGCGVTTATAVGAAVAVAAGAVALAAADGAAAAVSVAEGSGAAAEVAAVAAATAAEGICAAAALALAAAASASDVLCVSMKVAPTAATTTNAAAPAARKITLLLFSGGTVDPPAPVPYWSIAGAERTGAESAPLKAPPLDRFMMSSTRLRFLSSPRPIWALSCRMSIRPEASAPGTVGGRSPPLLVRAESENSTLFSLRAPVATAGLCSS